MLRAAAERSEGFSGRELNKMLISLQAAAYATDDAAVTRTMFDDILAHFVEQHAQRQAWSSVKPPTH